MTKISGIAVVAMMALITFAGCKKKSSSTTTPATGSMAATAGAAALNSSNCSAHLSGDAYYIAAISTSGSASIDITIKTAGIAATTYTFDSTGLNHTAIYTSTGTETKMAKSGYVTISTVNAGVSFTGSFNFTCADSNSTVISGTFTAVIQ